MVARITPTATAAAALLLAGVGLPAAAAKYQLDTPEHILDSARTLAFDGMALYEGNRSGHTPGLLSETNPMDDGPYWWWHGGVFMTAYVDYWRRTGDASYNDVVAEGMLAQAGEDFDYQPHAHWDLLGSNDQCVWATGAAIAAESKFRAPPQGKPGWLRIAQNAFDRQAQRFDFEEKPLGQNYNCGGGLRQDIDTRANGFYYKDSLSNACFLSLGARLATLTGNETYAKYAERAWDWLWDIEFINHDTWAVHLGAAMVHNCTGMAKQRYSGGAAALVEGAAFMANFTKGSAVWKDRTQKLMDSTLSFFFPKDIAFEVMCEERSSCYIDMFAYKGMLHRALSSAIQVAPFTAVKTRPILLKSAQAAVAQCTGGDSGRACGFYWQNGTYVKSWGPGVLEQINVLSAVSGLVDERPTAAGSNGGSSSGSQSSGSGGGAGSASAPAPGSSPSTPANAASRHVEIGAGLTLLSALTLLVAF